MELEKIQKINILVLKPISELLKANVATFDKNGKVIQPFYFGNEICKMIKTHEIGRNICQNSHKRVLNSAKLKNNTVKKSIIEKELSKITPIAYPDDEKGPIIIDYCDAGLLKVLYPIKNNGEIVGYTGICGCFKEGEEEYSLKKLASVSEVISVDKDKLLNLAKDEIRSLSENEIKVVLELVKNMIKYDIDFKKLSACLSKKELSEEDEEYILKFLEYFVLPTAEIINSNLMFFDNELNALFVMDYDKFSFVMEQMDYNKDRIRKLDKPLFLEQEKMFIIPIHKLYLVGTISENNKYTTEEIKKFVYVIYQYFQIVV
ncbi:PocR ligand-binding domain-containing protein [Methanotorris igneus]|uniref:PocR domain-containing protein n=1 Tax=Methanotorris igneus (strain DSM 5666 / JCM 11834 / Kol 5) TaxID=880724 RepID=F6BDM2_METIK|nr:PocR ligand-binding domain-containing protein [Methanotorris igneus]AEF96583.1 hypothetical protein Metig_1042 [Methanotorris igneus Kol 5]